MSEGSAPADGPQGIPPVPEARKSKPTTEAPSAPKPEQTTPSTEGSVTGGIDPDQHTADIAAITDDGNRSLGDVIRGWFTRSKESPARSTDTESPKSDEMAEDPADARREALRAALDTGDTGEPLSDNPDQALEDTIDTGWKGTKGAGEKLAYLKASTRVVFTNAVVGLANVGASDRYKKVAMGGSLALMGVALASRLMGTDLGGYDEQAVMAADVGSGGTDAIPTVDADSFGGVSNLAHTDAAGSVPTFTRDEGPNFDQAGAAPRLTIDGANAADSLLDIGQADNPVGAPAGVDGGDIAPGQGGPGPEDPGQAGQGPEDPASTPPGPEDTTDITREQKQAMFDKLQELFDKNVDKGDTRSEVINEQMTDFLNNNDVGLENWTNPDNDVTKAAVLTDMMNDMMELTGKDPDKLATSNDHFIIARETLYDFDFVNGEHNYGGEMAIMLNRALESSDAQDYIDNVMPDYGDLKEAIDKGYLKQDGWTGTDGVNSLEEFKALEHPEDHGNEAADSGGRDAEPTVELGAEPQTAHIQVPNGSEVEIAIPQGTTVDTLETTLSTNTTFIENVNAFATNQDIPTELAKYTILMDAKYDLLDQGIDVRNFNPDATAAGTAIIGEIGPKEEFTYDANALWNAIEDRVDTIATSRGWELESNDESYLKQILTDMIIDNIQSHPTDAMKNLQQGDTISLEALGFNESQVSELMAKAYAESSRADYAAHVMREYMDAKKDWS